jgi:UDP-N-acetylmuramoylalanine--D-glutamate ligase
MNALNIMTVKPEQAVYTLVVGLGKTGLSVVRYLHVLGEPMVVVDSRDIPPGLNVLKAEYSDVELHTGAFDISLFTSAHRIIVSPGVALTEPGLLAARNNNIEIIGDIDLFAHEVNAPVIGITGSNGKSTVTTLLTLMAKHAGLKSVASGNIGLPVLDSLDEQAALYVLELSSFQLEKLQNLPMKAAVVLNISADHLDRYENLAAYALSKQAIYQNAEVCVVNKDDDIAAQTSGKTGQQIGFTLNKPGAGEFGLCEDPVEATKVVLCFGHQVLMGIDEMQLKGKHNLQNALAALALGQAAGLPMDSMLAVLREFKGLAHRTQLVAQIEGVDWINDSKATNVGAAIAAMTGLPGKHVLIAGGIAKGADFSELSDIVKQHCRAVVLLGQDADKLAAVMPQGMTVKHVNDMFCAVLAAKELAQTGDNVLLAPACASFDMFDSFEHRGDVFIQAVEALQS